MFSLNILQLRPVDDIYLPPSRPSSARGRAHRPPPSFPSSSLVIPSIHLDPPPSHFSPAYPPDGSEGFLFYFDPTCSKARKLEAEVETLTCGWRAPLVTRHLPQATHVLVDSQSSFGERLFQEEGRGTFLLDLRWIKDSLSSGRWQHETDYLYHPLVSRLVLATLFPEEEPSTSMVLGPTSIPLDDANEVEDIPVEPVQEVEPAMEALEEDEPRVVAGVEEGAEAAARVGSEGGDELGDEDEDVSNPLRSNSPSIPFDEPSDDKFATFLAALGFNVSPWDRDDEGRDNFDLYVRSHPNQTADWWRTRFNKENNLFIILLNALKSQPSHEIEEVEADPSSAQSTNTGVIDGSEVEIREEATIAELPLEDEYEDENEELEKPVEEPVEMGSVEPVTEEDEPTLSIEILEEMFLEMRRGLELKNSFPVEDSRVATFEASTDVQLSPEVDANGERDEPVEESNRKETVGLLDLLEDGEPPFQLDLQKETKEQQQKSHHSSFSSNSSSSTSTPSSSTHSIYSTPGSSPSLSSSRLSSRSPGPSSPKRRRLASREASNPPPPIVDASGSNSFPLPPLPSPLSPSPSPFASSPRSRQTLSSSLSPPPDLPPPKPFEPPSFLELGVPSSFLPSSPSFCPTCFFCGFEAKSKKSIQRNSICLPCFDWLDKKIDERGDSVKEVEALEDGGRLAWALCMWKVNGLRERRGRVREEDGGTMKVEWRGGEL